MNEAFRSRFTVFIIPYPGCFATRGTGRDTRKVDGKHSEMKPKRRRAAPLTAKPAKRGGKTSNQPLTRREAFATITV